jgi:predicted ester cyclase
MTADMDMLSHATDRLSAADLDAFKTGDEIACRFVMAGTHSGEFMGVPKSAIE